MARDIHYIKYTYKQNDELPFRLDGIDYDGEFSTRTAAVDLESAIAGFIRLSGLSEAQIRSRMVYYEDYKEKNYDRQKISNLVFMYRSMDTSYGIGIRPCSTVSDRANGDVL